MHADHTAGLTSSWHSYTIYCSEVTRKLAIAKLGIKSELVVGLSLDEPVTINLDETGEETMTVTLLDANHCPGSVMFIFEGYFGKILYTGDFRFAEHFLTHSAIKGKQFDLLYLDNTYCSPKCLFPTRAIATISIMEIIRNHPKHKIVIGLHSLGKEGLLHTIAIAYKTWIGVDPVRKETLELLGMPHVFTCDVDSARIQVVKTQEINRRNIELWNWREPTIAILPTCLFFGASNPYENVPNVFVVPYSDHCSFDELRRFVQGVKPRKIIPIVHKHRLPPGETINSRVNMNIFQHLLDSSPSPQYTVPHSVEFFMAAEIMQDTKKTVKATRQVCLRKAAKSKKPCGVVFPSSPAEMEEENCVLAGSDTEGKAKMDSELDDEAHGMEKEINSDNRKAVTSSSIKQDSYSGGKANVNNDGGDKDLSVAQENKHERNPVASCIETDDKCDKNGIIPRENLPMKRENVGELDDHRGSSVTGVNEQCHKSGIIPRENLPMKRENIRGIGDHRDNSATAVDEQKPSKKTKFNIYTGCSCDFARQCLADMMKVGAIRDK